MSILLTVFKHESKPTGVQWGVQYDLLSTVRYICNLECDGTYFDTIRFFIQQALGCCGNKDNNGRKSDAS